MRLKKLFLAVILAGAVLAGCSHEKGGGADAVSAATARKGPPVPVLLKRYMPGAIADGMVKIAVLINSRDMDNARQFADGCVSEGRSMGFTVDIFISGGDEKKCRETAVGIARADYDGLIFTDGGLNFSYDILKPIADKGIQIVTFEALPYRDGKSIDGLSTTFRDDYNLAHQSLENLLASVHTEQGRPARVIRLACDPGITFMDRRAWEFDKMVSSGKITEAALVRMDNLENPHSAAWEALAAALRSLPQQVDAVWVPWDGFAGGCAEAIAAAGQNIKMFSIGISNDDIRLMQRHADIWVASTAVDSKLAGTVNMRILAAKLAGENVPYTFSFTPQLIKTADLNRAVNLANLQVMLPNGIDGKGLFDQYKWMIDLKTTQSKYLRIPPQKSAGQNPAAPAAGVP